MTGTRLLGWLLALLLAAGFTALGFWQYGRGGEKSAYLASWNAALSGAAVPLAAAGPLDRVERPQRVTGVLQVAAGGRWLLLDNARRGDAVGLRAYLIAQLSTGRGLLVDYGWLPFDRARGLPELPPLPAQLQAQGLLVPWPGQGIALGEVAWPAAGAPVLLVRLDRERIAAEAGIDLVSGVLRLAPAEQSRFARDLDALPNTLPAEKHYGYALQWWGLAAATLTVAAVLTFRRASR